MIAVAYPIDVTCGVQSATLALFGLGMLGMGWARRRKIRVSQVRPGRLS